MKKITKTLVFLFIGTTIFAQVEVYSASTASDFSNWYLIEVQPGGDGFNWIVEDVSSTPGMTAQGDALLSFSSTTFPVQPITPNDIAQSPSIDLTNYINTKLSWSRGAGSDIDFSENYTVYVVYDVNPNDNLIPWSNSDIVYTETIMMGQEMLSRTIDIPQMDGKDNVYVIFRHHDCSGQLFLAIDDVLITGEDSASSVIEQGSVHLSIYPVPAKDYITIDCDESITDLKIIDAQGRTVETIYDLDSNKLNVSQLETGVYTTVIKTVTGKIAIEKFIK